MGLDVKEAFKWGMDFLGYSPLGERQSSLQTRAFPSQIQVDVQQVTQAKRVMKWTPIFPVPVEAEQPDLVENRFLNHLLQVSGRKEVARYVYLDAESRLLGYTVRLEDADGNKTVMPLTYCRNRQGREY